MRAAAAIVALAIASAQAQNSNTKYTSELDMTIDPNTVSQTVRGKYHLLVAQRLKSLPFDYRTRC